ncbi:hypothetical protein Tdes44962_MAKER01305 [Teratosphaeria destructans]|uniref:Uncharacterized protein n=1 Tax=Teratosphaeria destructans TaxID=418781 RepID=A0A9W7T0M4_9PEZI|nr:hypothetical protein Tdes44962_MAKER01305 [Teratosphaeria destructans]
MQDVLKSPYRPLFLVLTSFGLLLVLLITFPPPPNAAPHPLFGHIFRTRGLHILVPTPDVRLDSCRLLLSAAAAGYPDPVLIGWGGRGLYNGSESNLFRISETLAYLRTLKKSAGDDLVVLTDPQAVVFQLPPEVLIRRYFRAIRRKNEKLKKDRIYRRRGPDGIPVMDSILFGASTSCVSNDILHSGVCTELSDHEFTAVPGSTNALYLDSGIMIGSVKDILALFIMVMDRIDEEFNDQFSDRHSEKHYLTMVWDDQELARNSARTGVAKDRLRYGMLPERVEFGIAIDQASEVFMSSASHEQEVTWMTFSESDGDPTMEKAVAASGWQDLMELPRPPIVIDEAADAPDGGVHKTWRDVSLGVNERTGEVFPVYRIVGNRRLHDVWWPGMWFHPNADQVLRTARKQRLKAMATELELGQPVHVAEVNKARYIAVPYSQGDEFQRMRSRDRGMAKGGVWNDAGVYMSWRETSAGTLLLVLAGQISPFSIFARSSRHGHIQLATRGLHYIVPTSKTTTGLCRLFMSSAVNGYPDPVLVGWGGAARQDGLSTKGHLFKVSEILYYLDTLRPAQDDDLVLVIDAFNLWLQLPPQVLIERYFQAIEKQDGRLDDAGILDENGASQESIKNTILFGADTECWPQDSDKGMHCQYMPDNPLADDVYGPATDGPRFLNSGTMIGPVKDLKRLLQAVISTIEAEFNEKFLHRTSDQHYIAMVWARQEQERTHLAANITKDVSTEASHEYHVAIDHDSDVFMLSSWSQPYIVWMTFDHSAMRTPSATQRSKHDPNRLDRLKLGPDLTSLQRPFPDTPRNSSLPQQITWADVILGTNTVTGKAFPAYHVTELTETLDARWLLMWFQAHGRALLRAQRARRVAATSTDAHAEAVVAEVRGVRYTTVHAHRGNRQQNSRARDWRNVNGGAWSDLGKYMTWNKLCAANEHEVFVD